MLKRLLNNSSSTLKRTPFYQFHLDHGATKMIPFCGWSMPLQYAEATVAQSVLHTRQLASLFDISHMNQITILSAAAAASSESNLSESVLDRLIPVDLPHMDPMQMRLGLFLNDQGGIIDDAIVGKIKELLPSFPSHIRIVSNAGTAERINFLLKTTFDRMESRNNAMLAVQGPASVEALRVGLFPDMAHDRLAFMHSAWIHPKEGIGPLLVTRCGYTGEDGFEICIPDERQAVTVANAIIGDRSLVRLAGLAARDCLRLEAGMCLSGQDFDEGTGPRDAGLAWTVKSRGTTRGAYRRVGVVYVDEEESAKTIRLPPLRPGLEIKMEGMADECISVPFKKIRPFQITSGTWSPTLERSIGMAYLPRNLAGTECINVDIRGKSYPLRITRMPFVQSKIKRQQ